MMQSHSKKLTYAGLMICIGILVGYLESFIVIPISVPGIKIGLSNIVSVMALYMFGPALAFMILCGRVLLSGLLFGSGISLIYSLSGAVISFAGMYLAKRAKVFSIYGVSITGGVLHNISQVMVAMIFVNVPFLLYYIPVLVIAGILAGIVIAFLSNVLIKRMNRFNF